MYVNYVISPKHMKQCHIYIQDSHIYFINCKYLLLHSTILYGPP